MYEQLTITTICGGGVGNVNHPITSMRLNNCFLFLTFGIQKWFEVGEIPF